MVLIKKLNKNKTSEKEEALENVKLQTKKLVYLIYGSTMSMDIKMSFIALIPKMTPEQLDRTIGIFEVKYLDEQTRHIDKKYQEKLQESVNKYEQEDNIANLEVIRSIKDVNDKETNNILCELKV